MAAKKQTKTTSKKTANKNYKAVYEQKQKAKRQMNAVILFTIGLLLVFIAAIEGQNVWKFMHDCLYGLFGLTAWAIPLSLIYIAIMTSMDQPIGEIRHKVWQTAIMVTLICSLVELCAKAPFGGIEKFFDCFPYLYQNGITLKGGGVFALFAGYPLLAMCGKAGAIIIVSLFLFAFIMLLTGSTLVGFFKTISTPVKKIEETYSQKREEQEKKSTSTFNIDVDLGPEANMPEHPVSSPKPSLEDLLGIEKPQDEKEKKQKARQKNSAEASTEAVKQPLDDLVKKLSENDPDKNDFGEAPSEPKEPIIDEHEQAKLYADENNNISRYIFPPISLLKASKNIANRDVSDELKSNAELLVDTLKSFGVQTKIIDISRGPTVTRYELQPSAGVKISKITGLSDDIALNLAVAGVRIEAPIPNKAAVGIEVPNKQNEVVTMREIVESNEFETAKSKVSVALGKDIAGNFAVTDIAKMPHLLIAGTTGSGKSVCINSIIISLLYKATPSEVRFLMVDPKVVELGVYNGIPHLLVPVVTDPRKASGALAWAVNEMLNRYKLFAENNVRDITSYNKLSEELDQKKQREKLNESSDKKQEEEIKTLDPLPQIVIIIDELADLMMAAPNEVEDSICRLAQMARAAGMHLIIATQRPSVDVITGLIKTNIPSRIAFKVSSQVDSRIILDASGAEKLLGNGDMLFNPVGNSKPIRIQGCYVSDKEISQVVDFIKNKAKADYDDKIIEEIDKQAAQEKSSGQGGNAEGLGDGDELLSDAVECVIEAGQASTSYLQRKLKVGYARAARLMDEMEEKGIIGAFEGSKPRQVLISRQQWIEMKMNNEE